MKILLVHGIGHSETNPDYYQPWMADITAGLKHAGLTTAPEYVGFHYDDYFDQTYRGPGIYAAALTEMLATAAWHWVSDPVSNLASHSRGFANPYGDTDLRWKAGMVAQFVVEGGLRQTIRDDLHQILAGGDFDMIAAHSLGTLLTYDFFRHDPAANKLLKNGQGVYLTFGSQINNDFARSRLFPGPIQMPGVRAWYHLYNPDDHVLTAPIRLSDPRFRQVDTPSESGHSPIATPAGPGYLDHPRTQTEVWNALALQESTSRSFVGAGGATAARKAVMSAPEVLTRKPQRRALLIGINEYPDPANRLEGCVNDTFRMSEVLQERGFDAKDIRVVLNDRATADGLRQRLAWLLDRAEDGMERVLFYSGHGAQMPGYNAYEEVDHLDECLVPYDFAWTEQTAITDKDIYRLYSDLPFGARFFAMFDCCHSGGLTRAGSNKVRSIDPPDDIRHRIMRWDKATQMWQERALPALNPDFGGTERDQRAYMGGNGATYKMGRAMRLRRAMTRGRYQGLDKGVRGPFLPVLLEACGEGELSYEYRHGVTSYGAFTYAVTEILRQQKGITFQDLVAEANKRLQWLGYKNQVAQLVGPKVVTTRPVPSGEDPSPATESVSALTATAARRQKKPAKPTSTRLTPPPTRKKK